MSSLATVIASGGVAVIATDTVYGLCCDAENPAAVERLLALKRRPDGKPAALAFASTAAALAALPELGDRTRSALTALLPGPLTVLLPNPAARFPLAGGVLLGVRVFEPAPAVQRPLLLTSANLAGEPDARALAEVSELIREGADLALDGGELAGVASTVVDLSAYEVRGEWRIARAGPCSAAILERALLGSGK
jgi:L-threonylcarbamoyladenylate synthase